MEIAKKMSTCNDIISLSSRLPSSSAKAKPIIERIIATAMQKEGVVFIMEWGSLVAAIPPQSCQRKGSCKNRQVLFDTYVLHKVHTISTTT